MTRLTEMSAVVLTGGSSRRMGRDKAFIEVGGREILNRVLEDALAEVSDIVLVGGDAAAQGEALLRYGWVGGGRKPRFERDGRRARVLDDRRPGMGPLAGLEVGLKAATHPTAWVLACDLPFMDAAIGRRMVDELDRHLTGGTETEAEGAAGTPGAETEDAERPVAVVPLLDTPVPPLCLLCETRAAAAASRCLDAGRLKMLDFLGELRLYWLPTDHFVDLGDPERTFLNVNRPEDVERAERLVI